MRILSKRQLKELVLYSPQHVARLEKAGLFPKRVQLGPNRVVHIPGYPPTYSDNIRPFVPGYPPSFDALP